MADHASPLHHAATEFREEVATAGVADPQDVAEQLMIPMDGAIVTAHAIGDGESARHTRKMAEAILSAAIG